MRYATMNRLIRLPIAVWLVLFVLLFSAKLAWSEPYKSDAGPHEVGSFLLELHDEERDREVPIKVYVPKGTADARPVVIVSHGLGGSRENLSYLGERWASYGYVCVHLQHLGSDETVWRDVPARDRLKAMRRAAMTPQVAIDRANDVPYVLDKLVGMNQENGSRLQGKLDMNKVAIAGHSFGAWSAMAAGGMTVGGKRGKHYSDERIRCMIPLSPPVVASERLYETTYGTLNIPALFMTGTLDTSVINNTEAKDRLIPYATMRGASEEGVPKYQINFNGADHMTFGGPHRGSKLLRKADLETEPIFHSLIQQGTTAFLDCYLLGDRKAKQWLNDGGFIDAVGEHGDVAVDAK